MERPSYNKQIRSKHAQLATKSLPMEIMDIIKKLVLIIIICNFIPVSQTMLLHRNIPEDASLDFMALARKYGQRAEEYEVTTKDGYILKLFHIPGDRNKTVLLMHGLFDSADTFIIRGKKSLVIALADTGYDVWAGNVRGNKYSRRHRTLNNTAAEFWDFSFHEIGLYDLPAIIDFILSVNSVDKICAIGHSQGNSIFYVLASSIPEYNDKIKGLIALAPVSTFNHIKSSLTAIVKLAPLINSYLIAMKQEEIFSEKSFPRVLINKFCLPRDIGYEVCAKNILFIIDGLDYDELEPDFFPIVVAHYPTSSSRKNLMHMAQIATRKSFSPYDYGVQKNLEIYKTKFPPPYDLKRVTMKVALFAGRNDGLDPIKDVETLIKLLPRAEYLVMERKQVNHIDFVWGKNMNKYLFPHIFRVLEKFN